MKQIYTWMLAAILTLSCSNLYAQTKNGQVNAFFTTAEMPKLSIVPPPNDTTNARFKYDIYKFYWGLQQRSDTIRAAIAIRDALYGLETIISEFSAPFGLRISEVETPCIYLLLKESLATCDSICTLPKLFWMRQRPFKVLGLHSLTPWDEAALSSSGSWPSGHTILGWSAALLLSEINPERTDTLLARGILFGESRIVCGVHWASDVEDARLFASVAYNKLQSSERFQDLMQQAKNEFAEKCRSMTLRGSALEEWNAGETVTEEAIQTFGGLDSCFLSEPIPDKVWARMQGKTYKENPYIHRSDLRYIRALHWDFDQKIHIGEMVCNTLIADRLVAILRQLFEARYPIQRMVLPDVYNADDERQMRENNSSCFCYRAVAGTTVLSKHARGLAVDLNTLYNPYYKDRSDGTRFVQPATASVYCDRSNWFPYRIDHNDLAYRLFTEQGFEWGGDWTSVKDYQHFEFKGF